MSSRGKHIPHHLLRMPRELGQTAMHTTRFLAAHASVSGRNFTFAVFEWRTADALGTMPMPMPRPTIRHTASKLRKRTR